MNCALCDSRSTNLISEYDNKEDAFADVLGGIERNRLRDTDTLILEAENEQGEVQFSVQGAELAALARDRVRPNLVAS